MRYKIPRGVWVVLLIVAGFAFWQWKTHSATQGETTIRQIHPVRGAIRSVVSTTGSVLPKNRLEVRPPVSGRVDEILVKEGEKVKVAQVLAQMSSTERAALLDAARGQGEETLKYWQEVYRAIPLVSPIDGEVIVATTQPGQTVSSSDAVIVLSDHLIVRAQVDETDIGKIKPGQQAVVTLDAYPDVKIKASVEHIYYESKTVNNVTVYEVDLLPEEMPAFFRSGMNANIDFIAKSQENTLLVPVEAVAMVKDKAFCYVKEGPNGSVVRQPVELGITDEKNVEVISGLSESDTVIVHSRKYALPQSQTTSNPFMPFRQQRRPSQGSR